MPTELELYYENQKQIFFKQLPAFLDALEKGQHPIVGDRDQALSVFREIEILLCLKNNLPEYNSQVKGKLIIPNEKLEKLIRQTLIYGFSFLDENGFSGGYDIDGKKYATNFHFFSSMVAIMAIQEINYTNDPEIKQLITRIKNGVSKSLPTLEQYANYERKAYRGLNLIFIDIATAITAGDFFNEPQWVKIGDKAKDRILKRFDPVEGYIPDYRDEDENPGPSASYSIYSAFTITYLVRVRPESHLALLLKKAIEWNLKTIYPNAQAVDIFDERGRLKPYRLQDACKHSLQNRSTLFTFSKGGRDYIKYIEKNANSCTPIDGVATDIYLYQIILSKNPEFIFIMDDPISKWHTNEKEFCYRYQDKLSAISKINNWVIAGHGYLSGKIDPKAMWHRELQQHFSLYYHGLGSVLGGGNSLGQPEFSTLKTAKSYLCDKVIISEATSNSQKIYLKNGETEIEIQVHCLSVVEAKIICNVINTQSSEKAYLQIPLTCYAYRTYFHTENHIPKEFKNENATGLIEKSLAIFTKNEDGNFKIECEISRPATYQWPIIPVNVREPGIPPLSIENAVLLLSIPLEANKSSITMSIKIQPNN